MLIKAPSQYNCDNMRSGDVIIVNKPSLVYRLYRKLFLKNKVKIRFKTKWTTNPQEVEEYQEDCILVEELDMLCNQVYNNEVPYSINYKDIFPQKTNGILKSLKIGSVNMQLVFPNNFSITIPLDKVKQGIQTNNNVISQYTLQLSVEDQLKFMKYKGDYFKTSTLSQNIKEWNASYCTICGKPICFVFNEEGVTIVNKCDCGNIKVNLNSLTWDELAVWYYSQVDKRVKQRCDELWFKKV